MKKSLAVAIIFLFISVAFVPGINFTVVKASSDNDYVEVTSEACGIKGFGNTTVKLTKQQYQDLQNYLVEFRAQLNTTTTREEAVPIFKDAVVELNKYGLLPKGMSIEQAQKLVMGQNKNLMRLQQKLLHNHLSALDDNNNILCLVAGCTDNTFIIGPISAIGISALMTESFLAFFLVSLIHSSTLASFVWSVIYSINLILLALLNSFPVSLLNIGITGFGVVGHQHGGLFFPSEGTIFTIGLKGPKLWVGPFYGHLVLPLRFLMITIGMVGFKGIKIAILDNCFYLGSALWVKIDDTAL